MSLLFVYIFRDDIKYKTSLLLNFNIFPALLENKSDVYVEILKFSFPKII